ncbi:MAG TPA: M48 family metalloprotease [Burkholderiales bacterium]|nr:M48 family metalloprotease [Burkholderiales bacterium]
MRAFALLLALCLSVLPRAFGQALPDLGEGSSTVLPPQLERKIGEGIMREIRSREPSYLDDPEISDYLNQLGATLVAAVPGARQDFEFFAIRDASVNAFALPGGFVGVHTGLLTTAESESELASVLAHEISHVTQRHIARMLGTQQQMQIPGLIALAAALLLGRSRPDIAQGAIMAAQGVMAQTQLSYSRDFEREADRIGFQTLSTAGFDVRAMAVFFEKMQRTTRVMDDGSVPGYLRSHPVTTERIADAQARAANLPYRQHPDSLDFHLVRAKLRAEFGDPRDAVTEFKAAVGDLRYANEIAARYGLAVALLRAKRPRETEVELSRLGDRAKGSPMFVTLAARARQTQGDDAGALKLLKEGAARWPQRRSVVYAYAELLGTQGRSDEVLAVIEPQMRLYPRDERLHEMRARAFAALGKRLRQHQAQAEVYALRGSLPAAIEQLQLAQAAGDGNFYELSAVEARLKELRAEHTRDLKEARKKQ